ISRTSVPANSLAARCYCAQKVCSLHPMGLNLVTTLELVKSAGGEEGSYEATNGRVDRLGRFRRWAVDLDLNAPVLDPHGITADLDSRTISPGTVAQAKTPCVPGTGHNSILDIPSGERSPHMRTNIVDRKILAPVVKDGDELAGNFDCP